MSALSFLDFSFTYSQQQKPSLSKVCFDIQEGQFTSVMGHTGAGKSTACLAACGLLFSFFQGESRGRTLLFGKDVNSLSKLERSRYAGIVFQDFEQQLFSTRADLEAAFYPENLGVERKELLEHVQQALGMTGLTGFEKRNPASLSGGEKQRLAIASVFSGKPAFLVLDEPTTDLDTDGKTKILECVRALRNEKHSILFVEHEAEEVLFADRVVLLKDGQVVRAGKPEEVFQDVSLLRSCGVKPPFCVELLEALGISEKVFSCGETYHVLQSRGYTISPQEYTNVCSQKSASIKTEKPVVCLDKVSFSYEKSEPVLNSISLEIFPGEFAALAGKNGSGKTTLLNLLTGILKPDQGAVYLCGRNIRSLRFLEISKTIAFVFQNPDHQIFKDSVFEEAAFALRNLNTGKREIEQRVRESLFAVGLSGYEDANPFSLTKGERQRLAVASALAMKPKLLLLDEPTTGLDHNHIASMMELLKEINKTAGCAVVIVTHSLWVVARYAERCILLQNGQITGDGSTRDILPAYDDRTPGILLSRYFGKTLLTMDEWKKCLVKQPVAR